MKKENLKNVTASFQAQLRNEARRLGVPFAEILQYYGMERFLSRLSKSRYVNKFMLKGGLLLYGWNIPLRRPTRDIDFRGYLDNSETAILSVMQDIIAAPVPDDGVIFEAETLKVEQTQIDADYEGLRVKFTGHLGNSKIPMQIDIGFSDVVADRTLQVDFPTLFREPEALRLKCYPKESIVSEKFHAMLHHAELNSRMKDYYDIWLLSKTFDFDSLSLQRAIKATFKQRETELPTERPSALTVEFASDNRSRWRNFLTKIDRAAGEVTDFVNIIEAIWVFLEPPMQMSSGGRSKNLQWHPQTGWQENIRKISP